MTSKEPMPTPLNLCLQLVNLLLSAETCFSAYLAFAGGLSAKHKPEILKCLNEVQDTTKDPDTLNGLDIMKSFCEYLSVGVSELHIRLAYTLVRSGRDDLQNAQKLLETLENAEQ